MLVVFDIDGTIADISHRLHFIVPPEGHQGRFMKDWIAFDAASRNDEPIPPTIEILQSLAGSGEHTIVLLTGRNERNRENTIDWLELHKIPYDTLYMREKADRRHDTEVKKDVLKILKKRYHRVPDMVFEDRPRVVKMWRDQGIYCIDVYQGTKDF